MDNTPIEESLIFSPLLLVLWTFLVKLPITTDKLLAVVACVSDPVANSCIVIATCSEPDFTSLADWVSSLLLLVNISEAFFMPSITSFSITCIWLIAIASCPVSSFAVIANGSEVRSP